MPINMTAQWVDRIKPPESGRIEYFDEKTAGLLLRVSASGKKSWYVMYRLKGESKRLRLLLGGFPQITLEKARREADRVIDDAAEGIDHAAKRRLDKEGITFECLAIEYIEHYAKLKNKSWLADEQRLNRTLRIFPRWKKQKAKDIKRRDVIELIEEIAEKGAPIEANRTLGFVRKIFNWGIGRDLVETNPCLRVQPVAPETPRDRVLNADEIAKVWEAFNQLSPQMRDIFKLRLLTAQRGGEVMSMRWQDLDLNGKWWTIPAEFAKNGLSHRVPLSSPTLAILREIESKAKDSPWVFSSTGKGGHATNAQNAIERIRKLADIDFVAHDLRRTAASWMASMGIPRLVISKILNHAEGGVTRIYDRHSYDNEKAQALMAWAEKLIDMLV